MLGEREAVVVEASPVDIHGVAYVDLALRFRDGTAERARIGRESVPDDLHAGEVVVVDSAMHVIVAVRRPAGAGPAEGSPPGV